MPIIHRGSRSSSSETITLLQGSISLDDAAAVREAVSVGFNTVTALESAALELAEFIKRNCEFADLFSDISPNNHPSEE